MNPRVHALTLRKLSVSNNLFFAPVAGYSDATFRGICRRYGAGLTFTEMVSVKGLLYDSEKTVRLLAPAAGERPRAVQLFGSDPDCFRRAAGEGLLEDFDVIDVNMGCPVPKIVKNGEGSALMADPVRAAGIVSALRKATDRVVSVKFRAGIDRETAPEFAKALEGAGADLLTMHGRTARQMYAGTADRGCMARTVRAVSVPVIANGDVTDVASANDLFDATGCAGIMIARGALADPALFSAIAGTPQPGCPEAILREEYEGLKGALGAEDALKNVRKYVPFLCRGKPGAAALRRRINVAASEEEFFAAVAAFARGEPAD